MQHKIEAKKVQAMFANIASRYDLTNTVLSMGIHHIWRRKLVKMAPALTNGLALDVCTGTGDLLPLLKKRFGNAYGLDFAFPMLVEGLSLQRERAEMGLCPRMQADALNQPFLDGKFDVITVSFGVRNFEDLTAGIKEMLRVLKPGGSLLVLEFGQPKNKLFSWLYNFYSKHVMPIIGGLLTGNRQAYEYLPETAAKFPCAYDFCEILSELGFCNVNYHQLSLGIAYAYSAVKPVT
ncbi:MAG: ubiquinone/menaquinone biosynthesis methyltransferase [Bdellovibrionales bacterium]|nr:ubiquinone/menaquinone biosynthesis methyltransferase [Bdellovibrionales bacterium]